MQSTALHSGFIWVDEEGSWSLGQAADTGAEMSAVEGMQTTAGAVSAYGHCLLVFVRESSYVLYLH